MGQNLLGQDLLGPVVQGFAAAGKEPERPGSVKPERAQLGWRYGEEIAIRRHISVDTSIT
jgi:hypothetical protein